jgi:hypothetical protein
MAKKGLSAMKVALHGERRARVREERIAPSLLKFVTHGGRKRWAEQASQKTLALRKTLQC